MIATDFLSTAFERLPTRAAACAMVRLRASDAVRIKDIVTEARAIFDARRMLIRYAITRHFRRLCQRFQLRAYRHTIFAAGCHAERRRDTPPFICRHLPPLRLRRSSSAARLLRDAAADMPLFRCYA